MARELDPALLAEAARFGGAPPSGSDWEAFLGSIDLVLQERELRLTTLEDLAAASTGELSRVRQSAARSFADLADVLAVLSESVRAFQDGARQGDEEGARVARHRFATQLNATWYAHPLPDESGGDLGSLRTVHQRLRGLSRSLIELVDEAAASVATRKELERAGALQRMWVPPDRVVVPGLELYHWFAPMAQCGGDWWSAHALTERDGLLVMGDVTGHGAPSAILTGVVKGACDLARMGMRDALRPSQLMRMVNRVVHESSKGEYMMTGVAVRVAAGGGSAWMTNAGHRPPLLVRGSSVQAVQAVRDPPLGSTEAHLYGESEVKLITGDLLVAYTDGVPECENATGAEFGEKALRQVCQEYGANGPRALRDRIREVVLEHRGDRRQTDDICLVVGRVT
ncbi:MAG: PP2C family protein-serine/threonine phosphatase [Myxococcota bacterium]